MSHRREPVLGDDDAGHDALVVAEEQEARRADGHEAGNEHIALEKGAASLANHGGGLLKAVCKTTKK